ncbi:MAG: cardiolipin synthase ClsB, partial [Burkholderiales bacterium]
DLNDPNHGRLEAPRLDFAVRLRGPIVAAVHLAARRQWWQVNALSELLGRSEEDGGHLPKLPEPVRSEIARAGRSRAMLVLRDNVRFRRTIERQYLRAIGRARREVLIACAYFVPGARFRRALLMAVRRGVRVRLLLQGRIEYPLAHYAAQAMYDELLRGGIEIVEYRPSFLHAKVAVIDDWATVGSSNIDPFSLLLAREANVVLIDRPFAAKLRERLLRAIDEGGAPVTQHRFRRLPLAVRLRHWLAILLLRIGLAVSGRTGEY